MSNASFFYESQYHYVVKKSTIDKSKVISSVTTFNFSDSAGKWFIKETLTTEEWVNPETGEPLPYPKALLTFL